MPKVLAKIGDTVYVREKSDESMETLETVHPNKVKAWLTFSNATRKKGTFEERIENIVAEVSGTKFREEKAKTIVTEEEFADLCKQAYNKGIPQKEVEDIVVVETDLTPLEKIVHAAELTYESSIEKIIAEVEVNAR